MKLEDAIKQIKEGKKRNFKQTVDLVISLKNIDLKKPENKFSKEVSLPHGRGKEIEVGLISDSLPNGIKKEDLEAMAKDKKQVSNLMKKYEFFLCEAPLMPIVGKLLGKYLAPRGKMPKLLPPNADAQKITDDLKSSVRVSVRSSLSIQVVIGSEELEDAKLKENASTVIETVRTSLPKGLTQMKNVMIKTTMGKPIKVDV